MINRDIDRDIISTPIDQVIPKDFGYYGIFYDYFRSGTVNSTNVSCHINKMKLDNFRIAEKINDGILSITPIGSFLLSDVDLAYIAIPFKYISLVDRKGMYGVEHPSCDLCRRNTQDVWSIASKNSVNYLCIYYYVPLFDMIICPDCFDRLYEYPSVLTRYRTVVDMIDNRKPFPDHDRPRDDCPRVFYTKKPWDVRQVERANIIRRFGRYNKNAGEIIDNFYKYIKTNEKV